MSVFAKSDPLRAMSGLPFAGLYRNAAGILSFVQVYGIQLQHLNPELPGVPERPSATIIVSSQLTFEM